MKWNQRGNSKRNWKRARVTGLRGSYRKTKEVHLRPCLSLILAPRLSLARNFARLTPEYNTCTLYTCTRQDNCQMPWRGYTLSIVWHRVRWNESILLRGALRHFQYIMRVHASYAILTRSSELPWIDVMVNTRRRNISKIPRIKEETLSFESNCLCIFILFYLKLLLLILKLPNLGNWHISNVSKLIIITKNDFDHIVHFSWNGNILFVIVVYM